MSAYNPPSPYFNGINFNNDFFPSVNSYLTQAIADARYLRLIGGYLTGFLGVNRTSAPRVALDVAGQTIMTDTLTLQMQQHNRQALF